ncbi:hypothetical protein D9M71_647040 [compost metagenome]
MQSFGLIDVAKRARSAATFAWQGVALFSTQVAAMLSVILRMLSRHFVRSLVICSICNDRSSFRNARNEAIQPLMAVSEMPANNDGQSIVIGSTYNASDA